MNARQKCKKLKKELEKYKNFKTGGTISTYTSVPIQHYQCKVQISEHEINEKFDNDEEKVDEIAKCQLANQFAHFIDDILPVKKEVTEDKERIYKSDLFIGVEDGGITR